MLRGFTSLLTEQLNQPKRIFLWVCVGLILLFSLVFEQNRMAAIAVPLGLSLIVIPLINIRWLWLLGIGLMPLSLNIEKFTTAVGLSIPTDPIAILLTIIFIIRFKAVKSMFFATIQHPIGFVVTLGFLWQFVTSIFSSNPLISFKYLASGLWFACSFFYFSIYFLQDDKNTTENKIQWLFISFIPLSIVVVYTLIGHGLAGFSLAASYHVMAPFYKDHTNYAASISIFTALFGILFLLYPSTKKVKFILGIGSVLTFLAVLFSYTRGAWLGLLVAGAIVFFVWGWQRFGKKAMLISLLILPLIWGVLYGLKNVDTKDDSRKGLLERLTSIFDTKTDLSNKERLNRWVCALAMVKERPIVGFGPGTYVLEYAPYQKSAWRTYVSTNIGDNGSAHNEFLLAAAETGLMGFFILVIWVLLAIYFGLKGYLFSKSQSVKALYLAASAGLIAYFTHGMVNNFLDQDKAAIPVYLCLALIVSLDSTYKKTTESLY